MWDLIVLVPYHACLFTFSINLWPFVHYTTHCILLDFSTGICWTSLFVILDVSGLFRRFYSIFDIKSCQQTVKTLIRRHIMWRLIWVCTDCL